MNPDAATALSALTPVEALQFLSTLGWSCAMGFALLLWAVMEKMDRDTKKENRSDSQASTRERLFGRQVAEGEPDQAEASGDEPSGGVVDDAGLSEEEGPTVL